MLFMTCTALTFNVHIKSPWIAANSGVFCLGRLRSYAVEELHSSYIEHHCTAYIEIAIISCHHQMWYWQASLAAKGPGSSSLPLHGHSTWSFQFGYLYMTLKANWSFGYMFYIQVTHFIISISIWCCKGDFSPIFSLFNFIMTFCAIFRLQTCIMKICNLISWLRTFAAHFMKKNVVEFKRANAGRFQMECAQICGEKF